MMGECPSARASRSEIPPALDKVITRMMARKPADRYATPDDVAKALEPHTRETSAASPGAITAKPATPVKNEAIQAPRRRKSALRPAPVAPVSDDAPIVRKSSRLPYVAAACVLGVIAVGVIIAMRSRDGTPDNSVPVAQGPNNEAPVENPFAPTVVEAPKVESKTMPTVELPKKEIEPAKVEPGKKEAPIKPVETKTVEPAKVEEGKKEPPTKVEPNPEVKPETKSPAKNEATAGPKFIPFWESLKCPSYCSIAITPDGKTAVTAGPGMDVWDLVTGKHVRNLAPATTKISGSVAISPDGKQAAGIAGNQTLRIWDLDSGKALRSYDYPAERRLSGLAWSNTGDYITVGSGPFLDIFEAATLTSKPSVGNKSELGEVQSVAFYRDGVTIVYGMENGQIRSVPVVGGKIFDAFRHTTATKINQLVSVNNLVLSVGLDKTFRVWETYPLLRELKRHDLKANARAVASSPSGLHAVTGGDDRMLHFWSLSKHTTLQSYQAGGAVRGIAFAANGRFFLSTSDDGKLRSWKVPEEAVRDWRDHLAGTWKVKYTNGASRTYKIEEDGSVYFFEDKVKGRLQRVSDHLILTFVLDHRLERIYPSRQGTLLIDHYMPSTSYPSGKPLEYAEAVRVDDAAPPSASKPSWDHVHLGQAKLMDGFVRLPKGRNDLTTKEWYAGGIDIHVTARTEKNNIRLHAFNGAGLIFNWEDNHSELRITRPDGSDKAESGSLATARVLPLTPNVWYPLRWRITEQGMSVWVKDELVFNEKRQHNLSVKRPIKVHAHDSDLDVSHFEVTPVK
jgi:WD40 repeat protein